MDLRPHRTTSLEAEEHGVNEDEEGGVVEIVDAEDEYILNQVLKSDFYDGLDPSPQGESLAASFSGADGRGGGSNAHLRYPQNQYKRGVGVIEARSVRRPPGEAGWK